MRKLRRVVVFFFVLIGVAISALYLGQRSLLFPAPNAAVPLALEDRVERVDLEIGQAFLGLPFDRGGPSPLLVFAHGNAELAYWSIDSFSQFRANGIAVLFLEYPGYGGAPGRVSAVSMVESALMAFDRVVERDDIDSDRIVVFGRSMGGGVASQLALRRNVSGLVLQSAFTSLRSLVSGLGFPSFLLRDNFDNAAALSKLTTPILLYHGTQDRIVPINHSEELLALAANARLITANCGHNDCPRPWAQILEFLVSIGVVDDDEHRIPV